MIQLLTGSEAYAGYHIRAWTGSATDEGIGLISLIEVWDATGQPICRFEEFLDASVQHRKGDWPSQDHDAARLLQERGIERARKAVAALALHELHGHRFETGNQP